MKKHIHYDVFVGLVLIAVSFALFPMTLKFPDTAGLFPQFILTVLCILGAYTLFHGVYQTKRERKMMEDGQEVTSIFNWQANKLPMAGYVMIVLYILAIKPIGFFVCTTVFMVIYMLFLNMRKPLVLVLVTLGVDCFIYFLFVVQLKLNLPSGILI